MLMQKLMEGLAAEAKVPKEVLSQCRFVHQKTSHAARKRTLAAAIGNQ
jgi:hypothetical protein